jgi:hypothetical protein
VLNISSASTVSKKYSTLAVNAPPHHHVMANDPHRLWGPARRDDMPKICDSPIFKIGKQKNST